MVELPKIVQVTFGNCDVCGEPVIVRSRRDLQDKIYWRACQACAAAERKLAEDEERERCEKFLRENPPETKLVAPMMTSFDPPLPKIPESATNAAMQVVKHPTTNQPLLKIRIWGTNNLGPYRMEMDWDIPFASAMSRNLNQILEPFSDQL
jgi:hypothetical protein